MNYHLTGSISSIFFFLSLWGIFHQIRVIGSRKLDPKIASVRGGITSILSLNFFACSYLGFLSFFLYGMSLDRFNYYFVWPRLVALCLLLYIFVELARDRQNRSAISVLAIAIISFLFAISLLTFNLDLAHHLRPVFQTMIVSVGFLIAQSLVHQIVLIRRSGETGAVSIRLHQLTLMKDIFTLIFAIVMGVSSGWPVIFCAGFAIIFKALLLWQFRWTRVSPLAAERRGLNYPAPQY